MSNKYLAIFDLDGTLFETIAVNYEAYSQALREFGYKIDYTYFSNFCNGKHYIDFLPAISTSDKDVIDAIHKRKKELYNIYLYRARPNEHLFRLINAMDGYYKVIVTTASRVNCLQILDFFSKRHLFDYIITQEDITNTKPDPQGFLLAMKQFNVNPENTIIFEDSDVGIEAGRRSGASLLTVNAF